MIRVAIADDHAVFRAGIISVLETDYKIKVSINAINGLDLLSQLDSSSVHPNVILLDINMPIMNGLETMSELKKRYPSIKIIILSFLKHNNLIANVILNGASAYINKDVDSSVLISIVKEIVENEFLPKKIICTSSTQKEYLDKSIVDRTTLLTKKEIKFIQLAACNLGYKEIAIQLGISIKTVENYRDKLFSKLKINNRAALVMYGVQNGLIFL